MRAGFWRAAAGPSITAVVAGSFWLLDRAGVAIPAPGAFLLLTVLFSTWVGGLGAGYASAAICVAATLPVLGKSVHFITFVTDPGLRIEMMTAFAAGLPLAVAGLRARVARQLDEERRTRAAVEAASRELMILQAALDNVDYGVILLDESLRARFINRASRKLWSIPDALADGRPHFRDLMRNACDLGAFTMPGVQFEAYIERRVALVDLGEETPVDLPLSDGRIVRLQCKALPAGGRFLSYTDVTDLVRHAEALERLATTDELTGICNRRHFLNLAETEWLRFKRDGKPFALLIFDVDLFKSINDRLGHTAGDAVIRSVAAMCQRAKRDADILARIGGEEFVLLLPEKRGEEAVAFAERLRQALEAEPFVVEGESLRVTVSIGVSETDRAMGGLGDLMRRADQALYDAKREGRNRVKSRFAVVPPTSHKTAAA